MPKVYEGSAELNIQPFLDALKTMETAANVSAVQISAVFQSLDQAISQALVGFQSTLQNTAQQVSAIGSALNGAQSTLQQGAQALQTQAQASLQQQQQNNTQAGQIRQAYLQAAQADQQRELAQLRAANQDTVAAYRDRAQQTLAELRLAGEARAREIQAEYAKERSELEQAIQQQRQLQQEQLKAAADAKNLQAQYLSGGDLGKAEAAEQSYKAAIAAAREAAETETSLQRQVTSAVQVERAAQMQAVAQFNAGLKEKGEQANRDFVNGWRKAWEQAVTDFQTKMSAVEQRWGQVFRAGGQLQSIGTQMTAISGSLGILGGKLTESAGTFDFWSRRTVAAAKAANESLFDAFGGTQQQTIQAFNDQILKLGRDLGTLQPDQVAQSWYLYQAAVGETIKTQDDLLKGQAALDAILKAAIVSDTDYETAIRGVTQAMAEFGLGQEQAAHATAVMLNLTQTSQSEFGDVLESFKMVGPQAARLGMSLEQVSAIIARLADTGIRGSSAGRALSMVLTTLIDPSEKAQDVLQSLLATQQGLTGSWRDLVFKGGEFIGMLDKVGEQGQVVQKGFLHTFADATKGMTEAQREYYIAAVFSQNATRTLIPLIGEYSDAMASGADKTATGKKRLEELQQEFENAQLQANLFAGQWDLVADGIKIKMGQATFTLREAFIRLGNIVAPIFIDILGWVGKAALAFSLFAEQHPALSKGLLTIAAAVGVLLGVFGPLLIGFGAILKTVATIPVTLTAIEGSLGLLGFPLKALGVSVAGLVGPFLAVIGVIGALYVAWKTNFLGMGEDLGRFFGELKNEFSALGDIIGGIFSLIEGLLSGNTEQVKAAVNTIGTAIVEAFAVIPQNLVGVLSGVGETIWNWANDTFGSLSDGMAQWGENLMYSLTDGIVTAASAVFDAVWGIAEGIAQFFRSFSPPKYGPLMGIFKWGHNLIGTLIEGMQSADLDAVTEIAGKIGDALQTNIKYTGGNADVYAETMTTANEKVAEMISIVKEGGRVSEEFFTPLKDGLGEWYDDVVKIALAYQDVYAAQHALDIEKEKLDLLKQQSKELDAQAKAREAAFNQALGATDPNNGYSQFAQEQMVDPTTEEGKAKIEQMRRTLSKEDFQNWIEWQRKLWDQRHDAEKSALDVQAEAEQNAVDAAQKQLDLAQKQYDTYVKMFEYAQRLLQLQEEEDRLKKQDDPNASKLNPAVYGNPEQLAAAKAEIAGVVGADGAILDEGTLKNNRGGDDVGALADAEKQREAEQQRITDLDALNRKKKAQFESDLINATSDEERKRIKEQKDAWDAAYKDEKARLQERLQFTKDIEDAAENQADRSKAAREAEKQAGFEADIKKLLGEQSPAIEDANALKKESKDLDEASIKAQGQLREEQRKLSDLQALNDQKKLDFEQRLREAAGDPEKIRRIKEEQEAWETAYKRALEVQQARVEAARRAQQDIGDQQQDSGAKKGGFEPPAFGSGGLGIDPSAAKKNQDILDDYKKKLKDLQDAQKQQGQETEKQRPTQERAGEIWKRITGIAHDMTNSSLSLQTRMQALGIIIGKEIIGPFGQWLGHVTGLDNVLGPLVPRVGELWTKLTTGNGVLAKLGGDFLYLYNALTNNGKLLQDLRGWWNDLWANLSTGNGFIKQASDFWNSFLLPALQGVWQFGKTQLAPFLGDVLVTVFGLLGQALRTAADVWTNILLPALKLVWDFIKTFVLPILEVALMAAFGILKAGLTELGWAWSNILWPAIKLVWQIIKEDLLPLLKLLTDAGLLVVELAVKGLAEAWDKFLKPAIQFIANFIGESVLPKFSALVSAINDNLKPAVSGLSSFFDTLWSKVSDVVTKVGDFINKIDDAISKWREWLGLSDKKPKEPSSPPSTDGSHAGGLDFVPKDGYIAELHKGEKVLTAAEAALYRSAEKGGLLGVLSTLAGSATARVAQATTPQVVNQHITNIKQGDQKTVNFGDVNIDASNPDEGRAFLHKLAFLA